MFIWIYISSQFDVREDEEQNVKLGQTIDLLLAAGYFRARIKGLSPFDKVCNVLHAVYMYHKMTLAHKCTYSNGFHVYIWMLCSVFIVSLAQVNWKDRFSHSVWIFFLSCYLYSYSTCFHACHNYQFSQNPLKLG